MVLKISRYTQIALFNIFREKFTENEKNASISQNAMFHPEFQMHSLISIIFSAFSLFKLPDS